MKLHREEKHTVNTKTISTILTLALTIGLCQTAAPTEAATPQLSTKKLLIEVGKTATLKLKKTSKKAKKAKWTVTSGKKVIRLSEKKKTSVKVKALKEGMAKISCKVGAKKLTCKVVVKESTKPEKTTNPNVTPTNIPANVPTLSPTQSPAAIASATPTSTPSQTPEVTKIPVRTHEPTENRIMAEPAKYTELPSADENGLPITRYYTNNRYYFFGTDILRSEIEVLTFSSSAAVPDEAIRSFDLSEKQNKSVMAWCVDTDVDGLYEMTIGQEKGVVANPNSSYLCCDVGKVEGIENLYTTDAINMSYMFYQYRADAPFGDAILDLGDNFDTSTVENMESMFQHTDHMFSSITLRLGDAFVFDSVKNSIFAFQIRASIYSKIYVSRENQKDFITDPEHHCAVNERELGTYIIVGDILSGQ